MTILKTPSSFPFQMVQPQYNPLTNENDIRVIQLLTKRDHPCHADGPIHCRIEHVSIDDDHLTAEGKGPKKGFDGTWLSPVVKDIEIQPRMRDGADSNVLWKRSLTEQISGKLPTPRGRRSPSSNRRADFRLKIDHNNGAKTDNPGYDSEAGLPWRYTWGDFIALSYVWGDSYINREIYVDDTLVLVTANLEAALRQLRNHSRIQQRFRIWIDALCINQADSDERAVQVARMKDIYARA